MPPARSYALGVDVGNAKLKLCVGTALRDVRWVSRPLPYDAKRPYDRGEDFERGIPLAIAAFLDESGVLPEQVDLACVVMTSGYAYPSFADGAHHTMACVQAALPKTTCGAFAVDGRLVPPDQVRDDPLVPFSNGMGAAQLARRILGESASGLVLDTGGDTTQTVPLVEGAFDPQACTAARGSLDYRLRRGRFVWVGSQTTPLEALAAKASVGGRVYPIVPRGVTFDNVSSILNLIPGNIAAKLSLFGLHPKRAHALRALADAVGIDRDLATEDELVGLAHHFHDLAVSRLASALGGMLEDLPARCGERAILFGLGGALARAALLRCGFDERHITHGAEHMPEDLSIVASCVGAFHRALEELRGECLSV